MAWTPTPALRVVLDTIGGPGRCAGTQPARAGPVTVQNIIAYYRFPHAKDSVPVAGRRLDLADLVRPGSTRRQWLHIRLVPRSTAFLQADLVDEILLYLAPQVAGAGAPIGELLPLDAMAQTKTFEFIDVAAQIGVICVACPGSGAASGSDPSPISSKGILMFPASSQAWAGSCFQPLGADVCGVVDPDHRLAGYLEAWAWATASPSMAPA